MKKKIKKDTGVSSVLRGQIGDNKKINKIEINFENPNVKMPPEGLRWMAFGIYEMLQKINEIIGERNKDVILKDKK